MKLLTLDVPSGHALGREELLEALEAAVYELATHFGLPLDSDRRPGLAAIVQHVEASRANIEHARVAAAQRAEEELVRLNTPQTIPGYDRSTDPRAQRAETAWPAPYPGRR